MNVDNNIPYSGVVRRPVTKAMIFAAGLGSRLKPWTDNHPKALAEVHGKSLLQRNIEYLQRYGIKEVVVNVHHFADQIVEAVQKNNGWGSTVTISSEVDEVLETGGGLLKASTLFTDESPVVIINVDILTDLNLDALIGYHQEKKPLATLVTSKRETSRYFLFDEGNNLCGWQNVKSGEVKPANLILKEKVARAFSGIHIIEQRIFSLIKQTGKFSMVDVYLDLMADHTIKSFDNSGNRFIDVGKPESIGKAEIMFPI
ncbi:MAG TPA: sugar phosphate nucleotidyltransferase [Segetibacter sp.]